MIILGLPILYCCPISTMVSCIRAAQFLEDPWYATLMWQWNSSGRDESRTDKYEIVLASFKKLSKIWNFIEYTSDLHTKKNGSMTALFKSITCTSKALNSLLVHPFLHLLQVLFLLNGLYITRALHFFKNFVCRVIYSMKPHNTVKRCQQH